MRQQQVRHTCPKDVPSRRQPDSAKCVVLLQEVVILSSAILFNTHFPKADHAHIATPAAGRLQSGCDSLQHPCTRRVPQRHRELGSETL